MTASQVTLFIVASILPGLLVSLAATAALRWLAPACGFVDRPDARKSHASPTPLGGGIAIWLGIVLPLICGLSTVALIQAEMFPLDIVPDFASPHLNGVSQQSGKLVGLLGTATILMLLGLADDRMGLPWQARLSVQFLVALGCVYCIDDLHLTMFMELPLVTAGLSVLWIVALINSFNMLDNMDGLSAGVAAIAAAMLAAILLLAPDPTTHQPQLFVAGLLLVVAGSASGFLWHNRPPAAIFMGDAGSYVLGFFLAVASLLATYASYQATSEGGIGRHAVLAPLCVLAVPLYDLLTVVAIRLASGRSPFAADRNHFSHRLVDLGLTRPQAVFTIYLTTATCGLGGLLLHQVNMAGAVIVILLVLCVLGVVGIIETAARRRVRQALPKDDANPS